MSARFVNDYYFRRPPPRTAFRLFANQAVAPVVVVVAELASLALELRASWVLGELQ